VAAAAGRQTDSTRHQRAWLGGTGQHGRCKPSQPLALRSREGGERINREGMAQFFDAWWWGRRATSQTSRCQLSRCSRCQSGA